jgi:hypothetical protein
MKNLLAILFMFASLPLYAQEKFYEPTSDEIWELYLSRNPSIAQLLNIVESSHLEVFREKAGIEILSREHDMVTSMTLFHLTDSSMIRYLAFQELKPVLDNNGLRGLISIYESQKETEEAHMVAEELWQRKPSSDDLWLILRIDPCTASRAIDLMLLDIASLDKYDLTAIIKKGNADQQKKAWSKMLTIATRHDYESLENAPEPYRTYARHALFPLKKSADLDQLDLRDLIDLLRLLTQEQRP